MPDGLLVLRWSDQVGLEIIADYPKGIGSILSQATLLHIYNMNYSGKGPGVVGLTIESANFACYSSGLDSRYFIAVLLNLLENPDDFEEKLTEISKKILNNIEDNKYIEMLPSLLEEISNT